MSYRKLAALVVSLPLIFLLTELWRLYRIESTAGKFVAGMSLDYVVESLGQPDYRLDPSKLNTTIYCYSARLPLSYIYPMEWQVEFEGKKLVSSYRCFSP